MTDPYSVHAVAFAHVEANESCLQFLVFRSPFSIWLSIMAHHTGPHLRGAKDGPGPPMGGPGGPGGGRVGGAAGGGGSV